MESPAALVQASNIIQAFAGGILAFLVQVWNLILEATARTHRFLFAIPLQ